MTKIRYNYSRNKTMNLQILSLFLMVNYTMANEITKNLKFKLSTGDLMPAVGLGTAGIGRTPETQEDIKTVLDYALKAGYRQFDTAKVYENEENIGKALKELLPKHNLTRQDIWITTKLANNDQGEKAYEALQESLRKLQTDYVDLYLIHWPGGKKESNVNNSRLRVKSWQQMVKAFNNKLTKNIGVSNYLVKHLEELKSANYVVKPAVNQVEWHPFYHPQDLLDYCRKEGIFLQAYSSLGGTSIGNTDLIKHPKIQEIAKKLEKSPAQVLLKWALQQNIGIIPKSRSENHIHENIDLDFTISEEDMEILGSLEINSKYRPDPQFIA